MKNAYIRNRLADLKERVELQEDHCELSRLALVERAGICTVDQIADGWLESEINQIRQEVAEIKSLCDQIKLLEHLLKNAE